MKVGYNLATEPMIHLTIEGMMEGEKGAGGDWCGHLYLFDYLFTAIIHLRYEIIKTFLNTNNLI